MNQWSFSSHPLISSGLLRPLLILVKRILQDQKKTTTQAVHQIQNLKKNAWRCDVPSFFTKYFFQQEDQINYGMIRMKRQVFWLDSALMLLNWSFLFFSTKFNPFFLFSKEKVHKKEDKKFGKSSTEWSNAIYASLVLLFFFLEKVRRKSLYGMWYTKGVRYKKDSKCVSSLCVLFFLWFAFCIYIHYMELSPINQLPIAK